MSNNIVSRNVALAELVLKREPAQLLALAAAVFQLLSATVLHLSVNQQGVLNALAVAVAGLVTASLVSEEKAAPAVAGVVQSVLACALAFGVHLSPSLQSSVMAFTAAGVAFFIRTQVLVAAPATPPSIA